MIVKDMLCCSCGILIAHMRIGFLNDLMNVSCALLVQWRMVAGAFLAAMLINVLVMMVGNLTTARAMV